MSTTTFPDLTFTGPAVDDPLILARLPADLRQLLLTCNGFVAFHGGLHVRGACRSPDWHALSTAWDGAQALHRIYPTVRPADVPFAQDCIGFQFLIRNGSVVMLDGEIGRIRDLGCDLDAFFACCRERPDATLGLGPLRQFMADGQVLEPGRLLSVWPPYCTAEAAHGVSLRAIPASERVAFLADFAGRIAAAGDGTQIRVERID